MKKKCRYYINPEAMRTTIKCFQSNDPGCLAKNCPYSCKFFRHILTPIGWTREDLSHWINETVDLRILSRSAENHGEIVVIDRKLYICKHGPVIPFLEIQKKLI
jgi:hypothetical protein